MSTYHTEEDLKIRWDDVVRQLMPLAPEKIILFGSFARGQASVYSDVDLFVVQHTQLPFLKRLDAALELLRLRMPVDVLVWTPAEVEEALRHHNAFIESVLDEGKVIYETPRREP